jgi:hypothetical protein
VVFLKRSVGRSREDVYGRILCRSIVSDIGARSFRVFPSRGLQLGEGGAFLTSRCIK